MTDKHLRDGVYSKIISGKQMSAKELAKSFPEDTKIVYFNPEKDFHKTMRQEQSRNRDNFKKKIASIISEEKYTFLNNNPNLHNRIMFLVYGGSYAYGTRNTCSLVNQADYSESSFVSDLSTGYSGNMGFPLPEDWAFDQIRQYQLYVGGETNYIDIDKDVASGKYSGISNIDIYNVDTIDGWENNGDAVVNNTGNSIPVYSYKIKENGVYKAKDSFAVIPAYGIYSLRKHNPEREDTAGDNIYAVYFLDETGFVNCGYIDKGASTFITRSQGTPGDTSEDDFKRVEVIRNHNETGDTIDVTYGYGTTDGVWPMLVTKRLKVVNSYGDDAGYLEPGAIIGIPSENNPDITPEFEHTVTGASFPTMIQVTYKKENANADWMPLISGKNYGFVDLGLENGVLPGNRALVHPDSNY